MNEEHQHFQAIFDELFTFSHQQKVIFLEALLFNFTISGRGIWSDETSSDTEKAEAFKWLNELNHRIWNLRFELKEAVDNDSIKRLYENMKFYGEQSALLRAQLVPTTLLAYKVFAATG